MIRRSLVVLALLATTPALAQPAAVPPQPADAAPDGLEVTVSDDSDWQDTSIAIPAFATDNDVATQTNAGSTGALGVSLAQVITADLQNNGLFKPVGPGSLPRPTYPQIQAPAYPTWQA